MCKLPKDVELIVYKYIHREKTKRMNKEYMCSFACFFDDSVQYFTYIMNFYGNMYINYRQLPLPPNISPNIHDVYPIWSKCTDKPIMLPKNY